MSRIYYHIGNEYRCCGSTPSYSSDNSLCTLFAFADPLTHLHILKQRVQKLDLNVTDYDIKKYVLEDIWKNYEKIKMSSSKMLLAYTRHMLTAMGCGGGVPGISSIYWHEVDDEKQDKTFNIIYELIDTLL